MYFTDVINEYKKKLKETRKMEQQEITIAEAISVLAKELNEDEGYRYGWQANIAMAFKDEWEICKGEYGEQYCLNHVHEIANQSALNFLSLLCNNSLNAMLEWSQNQVKDKEEKDSKEKCSDESKCCCNEKTEEDCMDFGKECIIESVGRGSGEWVSPMEEIEIGQLVGETIDKVEFVHSSSNSQKQTWGKSGYSLGSVNKTEEGIISIYTESEKVCNIDLVEF